MTPTALKRALFGIENRTKKGENQPFLKGFKNLLECQKWRFWTMTTQPLLSSQKPKGMLQWAFGACLGNSTSKKIASKNELGKPCSCAGSKWHIWKPNGSKTTGNDFLPTLLEEHQRQQNSHDNVLDPTPLVPRSPECLACIVCQWCAKHGTICKICMCACPISVCSANCTMQYILYSAWRMGCRILPPPAWSQYSVLLDSRFSAMTHTFRGLLVGLWLYLRLLRSRGGLQLFRWLRLRLLLRPRPRSRSRSRSPSSPRYLTVGMQASENRNSV